MPELLVHAAVFGFIGGFAGAVWGSWRQERTKRREGRQHHEGGPRGAEQGTVEDV